MPRIECSTIVNADVDRIFALARDIERYPEFMPDVKSIRIVERSEKTQISEWVALISDLRIQIKWTEEDAWDEETLTCRWRQIKGDFQQYDGVWTFTPVAGGAEMKMVIDYQYEVPLVGALIKALVARLMKKNVEDMLAALKAQAEKA